MYVTCGEIIGTSRLNSNKEKNSNRENYFFPDLFFVINSSVINVAFTDKFGALKVHSNKEKQKRLKSLVCGRNLNDVKHTRQEN